MTDEKVYTPEVIQENPLPDGNAVVSLDALQPGNKTTGEMAPATIKDRGIPAKKVAHELLASALNTRTRKVLQEFQFTPSGALQIGDYQEGDSGDIRISPNGIVARDVHGNTTFALDGTDGSAVFAGTIQTGALVAGIISVGNNTWIIDGDPESPRIILYNNAIPELVLGEV